MTSLNAQRAAVEARVQRQQHYRSHLMGMTAYERHKQFVNDYVKFYGQNSNNPDAPQQLAKTDMDVLRESYRFIRQQDDNGDSWEARLAKRYYDKLYKEYAVADMSRYKESKIGLRWRSRQEVLSGKGQFVCGAKGCDEKAGLCSYEVNFGYTEAGQRKQALVKLRVCPGCAYKLNYKKEKQFRKVQQKLKRHAEEAERKSKRSKRTTDSPSPTSPDRPERSHDGSPEGSARDVEEQDGLRAGGPATPAGGSMQGNGAAAQSVLPADESVWEGKPQQTVTPEDEFEDYFEGMFM